MARYIAKNLVKNEICKKCLIQLSYAIGYKFPISIFVETFGTGVIDDSKIEKIIRDNFILTPEEIIKTLNLKRPIYYKTAAYGHFGRDCFNWEKIDVSLRVNV